MKLYYHKTMPEALIIELPSGERLRHDGLEIKPVVLASCTPYKVPRSYDQALIPVPDYVARFYMPEEED